MTIQRVSTAAVHPAKRLAFWNEICARAYRPMVIDAEASGFEGVMTRLSAGELEIASVRSTPLVVRDATSDVKAHRDARHFSLHVVYSGRCHIRHGGSEIIAETGDMFVADRSQRYELSFKERVQGLVLPPPWGRFGKHAEAFEALAGRRINVHRGAGAVLSTFVRSAWHELVECDGGEWPESASEVIWDLLTAVLEGDSGLDVSPRRTDRLRLEATAIVDNRLADPGLRSTGIAEALGVSDRYLQTAFAEIGTTPSRFLLARRLDAAAARLRRVGRLGRITDIALECGFSDLSYFSRVFRHRFGVSARTYQLRFGERAPGHN